ncbi:MAG: hypothetical protein QM820_60325 [Minicystis sp.]
MSGCGTTLGWYATCVAYLATPAAIRKEISRQALATYRRIQRLPPAWGEESDRRGAPLAVVRWIAWGKAQEERERRYREALASWDQAGRWPRGEGPSCCEGERDREQSVE